MRFGRVWISSIFGFLISLHAPAQDVVAARAGVVHFTEGAVLLDDQLLEHKAAAYPVIKEGATLRTQKGRAEVLLTPGVFLRLDENSAMRMVSTSLTDARVQFLQGAAIVDSLEASGRSPVTVLYRNFQVQFMKPGIYRIDSDTGVLQAYSGEAQVKPPEGKTAEVDSSHEYFFDLSLETTKMGDGAEDEFYDWAKDRNDAIAQQNQLAADANSDEEGGDADASGLGGGLYSGNVPSYAVPALPSTPAPGGNFAIGSTLIDPFLPFGTVPYVPFPITPVLVLVRPLRHPPAGSRWPAGAITTGAGIWRPVRWPPAAVSRPLAPTAVRPVSAPVSRPLVAPHPALGAAHPIGHR